MKKLRSIIIPAIIIPLLFLWAGGVCFAAGTAHAGAAENRPFLFEPTVTEIAAEEAAADVILPDGYVNLSGIKDFLVDDDTLYASVQSGVTAIDLPTNTVSGRASYTGGDILSGGFDRIKLFSGILYCLDAEYGGTGRGVLRLYDIALPSGDGEMFRISKNTSDDESLDYGVSEPDEFDILMPAGATDMDVAAVNGNPVVFLSFPDRIIGMKAEFDHSVDKAGYCVDFPKAGESDMVTGLSGVSGLSVNTLNVNGGKVYRLSVSADSGVSGLKTVKYFDFELNDRGEFDPEGEADIMRENPERITDVSTPDGLNFYLLLNNGLSVVDLKNKRLSRYAFRGGSIADGRLSASSMLRVYPGAVLDSGTVFVLDCLDSGTADEKCFLQEFGFRNNTLSFMKNVFCSADDSLGRFLEPVSVASAGTAEIMEAGETIKSNIYIADYSTDKVTVMNTHSHTAARLDYDFSRPFALAAANDGSLYVADDVSRLTAWNSELELLKEFEDFGEISDIAVASNNSVYVSDISGEGTVYRYDGGEAFEEYFEGFLADKLAMNTRASELFALTPDGRVARLESGKQPRYMAFSSNIPEGIVSGNTLEIPVSDIQVDYERNLYVLSEGGIYRFEYFEDENVSEYRTVKRFDIISDELSGAGRFVSMSICQSVTTATDYGDILLSDKAGGSVRKVSGRLLDVKIIDRIDTEDPVEWDINTPLADAEELEVRFTTSETRLYSFPDTGYPHIRLEEDTKLLVLRYELDSTDAFSFVLCEDKSGGKTRLYSGYVLRNYISEEPAPFRNYHFADGKVVNINSSVYRYPSMHAKRIADGEGTLTLGKDDAVTVAPFVYLDGRYADIDGNEWVAVRLENGVGFMLAAGVVGKHYMSEPKKNLATNASVVSNTVDRIPIFKLEGGEYIQIEDITIPRNTRIVLVDDFDDNKPYTHIIYVDPYGSIDCYVRTENVSLDDMSSGQIIFMIIFLLVIAILIVFFLFLFRHRMRAKKR